MKKGAISRVAVVAFVAIILTVIGGLGYYFVAIGGTNTSQYATVSTSSDTSPLMLYSADAYVNESISLEKGFTNSTGIEMAPPKAGGSLLLGQEIAQGNPVSVFLSVSKTAVQNVTLKNEYSGWAVSFATDQMGLAYSNATLQNSAAMTVIHAFNVAVSTNSTRDWYNFYSNLTSGAVKVGISNPNADPAGFRAWMVLEAAGHIYASNTTFFASRMQSNSGNITGASAADLIAPLQAGQIQFLFIYKSAITSQHLDLLRLPNGVNLSFPSYNSFYSQFTYSITSGVQKGGAIVLWITIPKDSTDSNSSLRFVVYVIENSQNLLKTFGLGSITPPKIYNDTSLPPSLQQLVEQGSLQHGGAL